LRFWFCICASGQPLIFPRGVSLAASINPQIARKWSGHLSDSMFQRYSILTTDDLREAFETTEKFREAEAAKQPQVVSMGRS